MRTKPQATNISYYIDLDLLESLDEYVSAEGKKRFPERVNRSGAISKFIKEGLEKHNPNYKQKKILENYHGSSKK
jgi:metal-responsive CopG/Arc/MetJ family transcriptional regulator